MMKRMSFSETIFLFVLALVIFGPKKLPEIARQAGKLLNEFRRASNEFKSQIEQEIAHLEVEDKKHTALPPSPVPEGTTSRISNYAGSELGPAAAPVTPAVAEDEPLFAAAATAKPEPSDGAGASPAASSPTSQESHV
jgi:Tat protein translocase TatB subunit